MVRILNKTAKDKGESYSPIIEDLLEAVEIKDVKNVVFTISSLDWADFWLPVREVESYRSGSSIKSYQKLLSKLKSDQKSLKNSIQSYQLFSPGSMPLFSGELYKDLKLVTEKIESVKRVVRALRSYNRSFEQKKLDNFLAAKEKLDTILSFSEKQLISHLTISEESVSNSDFDNKWSIRLLSAKTIGIFKLITRDIRRYFRNILRQLSKNMDDSSHDSIVVFKPIECNYVTVNYYKDVARRLFNKPYREAA